MSLTTEQKRTVEARLDRLKQRLNEANEHPARVVGVLKGTLDLIADVLLPAETEPPPTVWSNAPPYGRDE
jgi:hypothetical protein